MAVRLRLALALLRPLSGCSALGDLDVNVEGGNQGQGTITRPLSLTLADDETVAKAAQRICDRVKPGSEANVYFLGKVAGPNAVDLADWGKYRYECVPLEPMHGAAAPAGAAARPTPPAARVDLPAAVPPSAAGAAAAATEDARRRQCLRQRGSYEVCRGSCLLTSERPTEVLAAECSQGCRAPPADCK